MSWREQLIAATFRGAAFFVGGHEAELGRRVQVHEYPQRDKPYTEDLGRATRVFSLDAFVLGDDYLAQRDRLLRAVELPGPGQLKHPYLGEMRASCVSCRLVESTPEGGLARFALDFVESGDAEFKSDTASTAAAVAAAGTTCTAATQSSFTSRFNVAGKPQFVAEAALSNADRALAGMTSAVGKVRGAADQVAALQRDVDAARRDLITLIYTPASAAQALVGNLQQLVRSVAETPRDALTLARTFFRFGLDLPGVSPSTASLAAQWRNQAEQVQLVRVAAVSEGARAATGVQFESYQDAVTVRDEMVETMDDLMLGATTDAMYDALRSLRTSVVRDVAARGGDLARLVTWTPAVTMPALVAAQALYADATRAPELVLRNRVRHPLFVPGAAPLEVLSDAR